MNMYTQYPKCVTDSDLEKQFHCTNASIRFHLVQMCAVIVQLTSTILMDCFEF